MTTGDHIDELGMPPHGSPPDAPHHHGPTYGSYTKVAFYFQDQMSFVDDKVRITAGFRYDGKRTILFDDTFSPRVAGVFDVSSRPRPARRLEHGVPVPELQRALPGQLVLQRQRRLSSRLPLAVFSPNPGLVPEQIETFEVGAEYRFNAATCR